ncbi:MAG: C25 family cysteine peptidase [Acidobacteria bacterium]|nr:C25 family cysteine peptidase [Acidobacteriota bacterium]
MSDTILTFNGIDLDSGGYLHSPMTARQLRTLATGGTVDEKELEDLRQYWESRGPDFSMVEGRDYKKLDEAGWGVIFAAEPEPGVYEALKPLLDLRKEQASKKDERLYKEYTGMGGYLPGDTKRMFLKRGGAQVSGVVDPTRMPYYLLIVGDPDVIPYEFQYQMDVQYGVGRLHFDRVEDYAQYAASVIAAETGKIQLARKATFFGVNKAGDPSTELSARFLVDPLHKAVVKDQAEKWAIDLIGGEEATKARLGNLMGGSEAPAFLFTASHGMGGSNGSPKQLPYQGALVCQDYPAGFKGDARPYYFAGEDLSSDARLGGTIAMMFACYGAGTPKFNEFRQKDGQATAGQIAPKAFVAALPKAMLSHPKGGALAVIGHVERAWSCSFLNGKASTQTSTFESSVKKLLDGYPVGYAMEEFNSKYAELSSELLEMITLLKVQEKLKADPTEEFVSNWTENYDARNYSLVGDPAVRMPVVDVGAAAPVERESITVSFVAPAVVAAPTPSASEGSAIDFAAGFEVVTGSGAGRIVTRIEGDAAASWEVHKAAVESAIAKR